MDIDTEALQLPHASAVLQQLPRDPPAGSQPLQLEADGTDRAANGGAAEFNPQSAASGTSAQGGVSAQQDAGAAQPAAERALAEAEAFEAALTAASKVAHDDSTRYIHLLSIC